MDDENDNGCYLNKVVIRTIQVFVKLDHKTLEERRKLALHFAWFTHLRALQPACAAQHKHTFNGPLFGTTQVSRYQKAKPIWILLKQETVSGSGISWAICKSAPRSRQITTPAPDHSVFYRPGTLPAAQPTASKHRRQHSTIAAQIAT